MKDMKLFYFSIILTVLVFNVKLDSVPQLHFIVSGTLNGTAAFASLDFLTENEKYLYFSFDFDFHSTSVPNNPNLAYFLLSTEIDFPNEKSSQEKISFGFSLKNWDDINSLEEINNIRWEKLKLLYKEKPYSDINYYYKIRRTNKKMKTLIIRIPRNGYKEGSITIENILNLPDFNKEEHNSDI